ncbi:uncharacterized protein CTHT_0072820 [Thermochaetoides thermophila DSM 1495]|uniref:Uncharacterized protein n=1 Tax=Chaetomium thermophilum (strain DSM 1495 / CBS 144.50 / IMI 039719) TaxID=759272 RepID=G0SHN8_CHATD|nr:hypothetical protein CTHT_0072820 [Thermochaetoides thermophila DSM 1495]EGS16958.1 hypothetical protein CTHT_0072820 [Thermochaetoides thermophila DSM 1495]
MIILEPLQRRTAQSCYEEALRLSQTEDGSATPTPAAPDAVDTEYPTEIRRYIRSNGPPPETVLGDEGSLGDSLVAAPDAVGIEYQTEIERCFRSNMALPDILPVNSATRARASQNAISDKHSLSQGKAPIRKRFNARQQNCKTASVAKY